MIVPACLLGAALCSGPVFGQVGPPSWSGSTLVPSEVGFPVGLHEPADADRSRSLPRPVIHQAGAPTAPDVDFSSFFTTLGWNFTRGLFSTANLLPLVIGGGTALAVLPFDDEISDELRGRATELGDSGNIVGSPVTIGVSVGAMLLAVPFTENRRFRAFAFSLAQAHIVDTGLKYALKSAVSRTRPNGENENAFPSGHTVSTFAVATVAGHYYGTKVSVPAYTIAALVGVSRIENGKHYLSDVIFGATLGYIAGRTAVRGTERSLARQRMTLQPVVGWGRTGLVARWVF